MKNKPLFSFIVPVYNTGDLLFETLDSIDNQIVEKSSIQTVIVDDCSTDARTQEIINQLSETNTYKSLELTIVRNNVNMWLSKARREGVKKAKGEYLIMLDSDDTIEPDFLSLSYIVFQAFPECSWVYPSLRKFGFRNETVIVPNFSSKKLFLENYTSVCSMMKKELWDSLKGQKTLELSGGVKMYEDWDFWHRAMRRGKFGAPLKKPVFNYRQNISSLVTRSEEEGNMSILMAFRNNWTSLFGLPLSQKRYDKNDLHTSQFSFIDRIFRKVIKVITGRNPINFKLFDLILYIIAPKYFLKKRLNTANVRTKAHSMAGFANNFELDLDTKCNLGLDQSGAKRVLISHFFWQLGGAENVLLEYVKCLHKEGYEIIDVVVNNTDRGSELEKEFSKYTLRQYNLSDLAEFSYPKLIAFWEIIKIESPDFIFNMSNPFTYILLPEIKKHYPHIKTMDLLHAEEFNNNGWFEGARPFQQYLDERIVISQFWAKVLIQKYGEKKEKIKVIPNKLDRKRFIQKKEIRAERKKELRKKHQVPNESIVIGFMGRLDQPKQPEVIVELAKKLINNQNLYFIIVGDGQKFETLEDEIKKLTNLCHLPSTKTPENLLNLFDIGIFPSLFEGYPVISMECAALNIPVIVPNIQGFDEQIEKGNFGITYNLQSEEEDAQSIADILSTQLDDLLKKGENGQPFIDTYHNASKIDQSMIKLFS